MRIQTSISDSLYLQVELLAKRLGVSRSELIRTAVAAYIRTESGKNSGDNDTVSEQLDRVYSQETSEVDEALQRLQWASLEKEVW